MSNPKIHLEFQQALLEIYERYRPSSHSFFLHLANCRTADLLACGLLDEFYKRYQSAMHATRVMAYFLPHLDVLELRMRKLHILADDDGNSQGDSHQFQLRRTWTFMLGRSPLMADHELGELDQLKMHLDPTTAEFVAQVQELYPRSLGAWVLVEGLAHDWIGALLRALKVHFLGVERTDYFTENYSSGVEVRHAAESLEIVSLVLSRKPELFDRTLSSAMKMAEALNSLWSGLDGLLTKIPSDVPTQ